MGREANRSTTLTGDVRHINQGERPPGPVGGWGLPGLWRTDRIWAGSDYAERASTVDEECMRKSTAVPEGEAWGCCSAKKLRSHESSWCDWALTQGTARLCTCSELAITGFSPPTRAFPWHYLFVKDSLSTIYRYGPFSGSHSLLMMIFSKSSLQIFALSYADEKCWCHLKCLIMTAMMIWRPPLLGC